MAKPPKPKVLGDINLRSRSPRVGSGETGSGRYDSFSFLPQRLNLSYKVIRRIQLTKFLRLVICLGAALFLILGSAAAPTIFIRASTSPTNDSERQALELQLQELEGQINQYETQITSYQKQGKNLKGEITILNNKIAKLNLQIQAINLTLKQLNKNIGETQSQITITESSIAAKKAALGELLQNLYENEKASLVEVFLKNPKLSDFFADLNNITLLQGSLRAAVEQIIDLRKQLKDKQDQFYLAKADAESVQAYQNAQKNEIDGVKAEKGKLIEITKGQESKYQTLLKQTKETAAQIRSRIFQLLGGGELSFEEAYRYAKLAASATGVRPALLLAVLDRESALGQNVGKCNYKTAMSPSNQEIFLAIVSSLNVNPDLITVSCPNRDGVYGGAMGPAQFVPATWAIYGGYKKDADGVLRYDNANDLIRRISGNVGPSSPWNNADAFVATALYLKDAMAGCSSIYSAETSRERCVAAKYYAGSRWRRYLWTYGEAVVSRAKSFQEDIDTITG